MPEDQAINEKNNPDGPRLAADHDGVPRAAGKWSPPVRTKIRTEETSAGAGIGSDASSFTS